MPTSEETPTIPHQYHAPTNSAHLAYTTLGNEHATKASLFIHGWGCQASDFFPLIDERGRGRKNESDMSYIALAPDLPGHGNSPASTEPSIEAFAGVVRRLIERFEEVVLVGHSMGVRIVIALWDLLVSEQEKEQQQENLKAQKKKGIPARPPIVKALIFIDGSHYSLRPNLFAFDKGDSRSQTLTQEEISAKKEEAFHSMFSSHTPASFRRKTTDHVKNMDKIFSQNLRDSMIRYDTQHMKDKVEAFGAYQRKCAEGGEGEGMGPWLLNFQSSNSESGKRESMKKGDEGKHRWMQFLETATKDPKQIVVEGAMHFPHVDFPGLMAEDLGRFVREEVGWS